MMIISNGVRLYFEQRGAGTPALVFLHYWGGSSQTWQHVVERLSIDYRTVAIDQRGWGQSEAPAGGYALADMAADAVGVIEALDLESYVLVGHSMGGKVAQLIASLRPRGLIGLALVAPSPPTPLPMPIEARQGMVAAYDTRDSVIATVEHVLAPGGLDPRDLEIVIADSLRGSPVAKAAWPLSASQEDIGALVSQIDVPVLIASGSGDQVDPPEVLQRELLPRIPHADFHELPKVGHLVPLEAPAVLAGLIGNFVASVAPD